MAYVNCRKQLRSLHAPGFRRAALAPSPARYQHVGNISAQATGEIVRPLFRITYIYILQGGLEEGARRVRLGDAFPGIAQAGSVFY